jgi:hypothetical protein
MTASANNANPAVRSRLLPPLPPLPGVPMAYVGPTPSRRAARAR